MAPMYDVIVAGLGGMGSAAAYHLAARGQHVLGLDRNPPAHDRGSSHGRSRIIRQAYFEGADYVPLVLRAYELWEQLSRETDQHLLHITGGLMIGETESATVAGSLHSARTHNLPHELLDAAELEHRFPPLRPPAGTVAVYEPRAGFLDPEATVRAHLRRAVELGATLQFGESVLGWEASGDGVRVRTDQGSYAAARLVLAPGPWAPDLLASLGMPLTVLRQVMYWFDPIGGVAPFLPDRFPIFIWEPATGSMQFYGMPADAGATGGVKTAFHQLAGTACDPETIERTVHAHEVERMRRSNATYIPALAGRCIASATCMYTLTPDQDFVIGRHPEYPQVALAAGFSGHGYKFASVVGEILADLVNEGTTALPIDRFAPGRFANGAATTRNTHG